MTPCIVSLGQRFVFDVLDADTNRTCIYNESLEEIRLRAPDAQVMDWNEACLQVEGAYVTQGAKPITREHFEEMLAIMPPVRHRWSWQPDFECFELSERLSGRVVRYYVRIGQSCWTFDDVMLLDTDQIASRVQAAAEVQS